MTYTPKPIDLEGIELNEDLNELREAIAENAHEIWAKKRKDEGWNFGPQRDDNKKETPDLVRYSRLTEEEKEYDREMAMNTLKLIKKLGYDIVKKEDTELYKQLLTRIRNAGHEFHCPHCAKVNQEITPIFMHQEFCHKCGHKIDLDWNLYK